MISRDGSAKIGRFRAEYGNSPIVSTPRPRMSWIVEAPNDWLQQAYELRSDDEVVAVKSEESVLVPWPFPPLASRDRRVVQVRVTSTDGRRTEWSQPLLVEAGLFEASDWHGSFIGPLQAVAPVRDEPCPFLRHDFVVDGRIEVARLYMTALGVYEPYLNGSVIGDHVLAPNWTSYHNRLRYEVFDVSDQLHPGPNVLGAILGDGWYRGKLNDGMGIQGSRNVYGTQLALLAQLEIAFQDGRTQVVVSDESWRATTGPILASSIYDGERYDARLDLRGWAGPGYDASTWQRVAPVYHPLETLVIAADPPIRRSAEVPVTSVSESPSGKLIVDFGQNLVGRLRLKVSGSAGDTISIRHAEVLRDGELVRENFKWAEAQDVYTLKGAGTETWEPRFTFRGFRFAQIEGWPGSFDPESVCAIVLHTDFEQTGWFECSNTLVNRLHENAVWSLRGNFLGIPTDCPTRAERLGWTGDAQLFAPAACFLYDVNGSLVSWLRDLAAEQTAEGRVPHVIPNVFPLSVPEEFNPSNWPGDARSWLEGSMLTSSAAWGDAAVIIPWVLYQRFGDTGVLASQWQSMRKWVDYVEHLAGAKRLWEGAFHFGDWLDPWAPPGRPNQGQTPTDLIATAYFARSATLVARIADELGFDEEARHYNQLAAEIRTAFCSAFMDSAGNLNAASATAQALVIAFSLAETGEQRRNAGQRLGQLVRATGYRISTGTIGTAIICDALCDAGDVDGAYRLLLQTDMPSWLYQVTMGATTIWESWDAIQPDGHTTGTSLNHFALGTVVDWLHRSVAGLEPVEPGYRKMRFRPRPGGDLASASARHLTPYGIAAISWRSNDGRIEIEAEVPANTRAEVVLPDGTKPFEVASGSHRWSVEVDDGDRPHPPTRTRAHSTHTNP